MQRHCFVDRCGCNDILCFISTIKLWIPQLISLPRLLRDFGGASYCFPLSQILSLFCSIAPIWPSLVPGVTGAQSSVIVLISRLINPRVCDCAAGLVAVSSAQPRQTFPARRRQRLGYLIVSLLVTSSAERQIGFVLARVDTTDDAIWRCRLLAAAPLCRCWRC